MGANNFVLFESASGYGLFEVVENEEIGGLLAEVQASVSELSSFGRIVKLKAFQPFTSAENALENINNISEGLLGDDLKNFLEMNLPKVKSGKKAKFALGVADKGLAQAISDGLNAPCNSSETTLEIIRGVRMHFSNFVKELANGNLAKAQLGLGHSYSRAKVKFNVNRADNMIIQAIALLDQMDKDINTFAMRVREWYSWHFPELVKIVNDNYVYARCAAFIKNRSTLTEDSLEELSKIVLDEDKAQQILHASRTSMGMDMSEIDMINVDNFTTRLIKLAEYRRQLHEYLVSKMATVAPNLASLIGEAVGARLISHAGSLTNLAKCPASTVQILGAEKALFRALKTRGNTPKYGLLFHSTFIGRAAAKNKGRISRYLANKCAIASRIDSFIDEPTTKYGDKMREQVEERLAFYESGAAPRKNADVMQEVSEELKKDATKADKKSKKSKKDKKRPAEDDDEEMEEADEEVPVKKSKKDKKNKKQKKSEEEEAPAADADKKKKKKHKKKSKTAE
ncbi:snoRNP complex protein nop56 [Phytophthora boehmeriae]|uniref:Nucleolar protein 56 n=1 Tax=Phytophthora boehmeriae TaxID=109152 RepID=A0A8T1X863_9STRA|nr:snoRNP complex protein nop56 [Phytophthora boehmeriae]